MYPHIYDRLERLALKHGIPVASPSTTVSEMTPQEANLSAFLTAAARECGKDDRQQQRKFAILQAAAHLTDGRGWRAAVDIAVNMLENIDEVVDGSADLAHPKEKH